MHWLLSKLMSYGNQPAIISEGVITYAELVNHAQNLGTNAPIEINNSSKSIISILARLNGGNINLSYIDSVSINNIYSEVSNLMILGTSGTSGEAKQVVHDLDKFLEQYRTRNKKVNTILIYPLDHIAGIDVMFSVLSSGGTLVMTEDTSPLNVSKLIEQYQLSFLACTPTFLRLLLVSGAAEEYDLNSLKQISYGAERMPEALLETLKQRLPGATFRQTYGTTETGVLNIRSDNSVWLKPNSNITLRGNEIGVKVPSSFMGYVNEETSIENGYLYLGDTFRLTRDEIKITGRKSAMINVGGEKVNPAEVEEVLYQLEGINWCKVYAEENALMGNIVVADVLTDIDVKQVREHCQAKLRPYQVPPKINIVNQIQVTDRWKS